ncbi:unnamed protein product, partial [Prorocentrum cordatum]
MPPCVVDLVYGTMEAHMIHEDADVLGWLVLDIADAFWTLGLRPSERKFFAGKLRGKCYISHRLAQGSRGAPLAWCRFFVLAMRLTAAMFDAAELSAKACVGDPALASAGAGEQRSRIKAIVVLAWRALNLDLSFRKGQGDAVSELKEIIGSILETNVVSTQSLRASTPRGGGPGPPSPRAGATSLIMLTMVLRLKSSSRGLNIIARELALELAEAAHRPLVAEHIPGAANVLADVLSRAADPSKPRALPPALREASRARAPARGRSRHRALSPPPASPAAAGQSEPGLLQ